MNKKFSRFLAVALVLMLCMALAPSAYADIAAGTNGSVTVPVEKTLTMNENAVPEDVTFQFTLAGNTSATTEGTLTTENANNYMVYQGSTEGVKYTAGENATDAVSGSNGSVSLTFKANDSYTSASGSKSLTKTFNIDFSGVDFKEPGVYRYTFTETAKDGYTTDTTTYYIDVYVEYANNDDGTATNLTIGKIVVTSGTAGTVGSTVTSKLDKITMTNSKKTYNLALKKVVTGNQGSHNDAFTFTVTLSNVANGEYKYSTSGGTTGTITVSETGTVAAPAISLKHNETITIKDLPYGASYTIVEDASTTGYTLKNIALDGSDGKDATATTNVGERKVTDESLTADAFVTFTNNRSGAVPTGVLLTVAPFAALMGVGALGAVMILRKKKED